MALLALDQLGEQAERGLVRYRVEVLEVNPEGPQQRRLRLTVSDGDVLGRGLCPLETLEQLGQLLGGAARIVAWVTKLVEAAADPADRAGVVVEVVPQRVLDLELRRQRQPAARKLDQLAEQVEVVGEPDRVLVHVVAEA